MTGVRMVPPQYRKGGSHAAPEPIPFACVDCDCEVFQFPAGSPIPEPPRCATCQWLADVPDPLDRERLRAWLKEIDA